MTNKAPKKPTSARRILLVEDQEALAKIRAAFLAQQGYEVVWASDGEHARHLLSADCFHLVVTDSRLPDISGWEVASEAKNRGIPVILSSGYPVRLRSAQLAARGVNFLCPKPCSLQELHTVIRKALKTGRANIRRAAPVQKSQYEGLP